MRHTPVYAPDKDADWYSSAQCRDVDPDVMQPEVASWTEVQEAIKFCHGCPVFDQCKALAESQAGEPGQEAYGVHAGEWWGQPPKRPRSAVKLPEADLLRRLDEGWSLRQIAAEYKVSKTTVVKLRDASSR